MTPHRTTGTMSAPKAIVIKSSKNEVNGEYHIVPDEQWLGYPVWDQQTKRGQRIYSDSHGRWMIGTSNAMKKNAGWVLSEAHRDRMPHKVGTWLSFTDDGWKVLPIEVTASGTVSIEPGYLPQKTPTHLRRSPHTRSPPRSENSELECPASPFSFASPSRTPATCSPAPHENVKLSAMVAALQDQLKGSKTALIEATEELEKKQAELNVMRNQMQSTETILAAVKEERDKLTADTDKHIASMLSYKPGKQTTGVQTACEVGCPGCGGNASIGCEQWCPSKWHSPLISTSTGDSWKGLSFQACKGVQLSDGGTFVAKGTGGPSTTVVANKTVSEGSHRVAYTIEGLYGSGKRSCVGISGTHQLDLRADGCVLVNGEVKGVLAPFKEGSIVIVTVDITVGTGHAYGSVVFSVDGTEGNFKLPPSPAHHLSPCVRLVAEGDAVRVDAIPEDALQRSDIKQQLVEKQARLRLTEETNTKLQQQLALAYDCVDVAARHMSEVDKCVQVAPPIDDAGTQTFVETYEIATATQHAPQYEHGCQTEQPERYAVSQQTEREETVAMCSTGTDASQDAPLVDSEVQTDLPPAIVPVKPISSLFHLQAEPIVCYKEEASPVLVPVPTEPPETSDFTGGPVGPSSRTCGLQCERGVAVKKVPSGNSNAQTAISGDITHVATVAQMLAAIDEDDWEAAFEVYPDGQHLSVEVGKQLLYRLEQRMQPSVPAARVLSTTATQVDDETPAAIVNILEAFNNGLPLPVDDTVAGGLAQLLMEPLSKLHSKLNEPKASLAGVQMLLAAMSRKEHANTVLTKMFPKGLPDECSDAAQQVYMMTKRSDKSKRRCTRVLEHVHKVMCLVKYWCLWVRTCTRKECKPPPLTTLPPLPREIRLPKKQTANELLREILQRPEPPAPATPPREDLMCTPVTAEVRKLMQQSLPTPDYSPLATSRKVSPKRTRQADCRHDPTFRSVYQELVMTNDDSDCDTPTLHINRHMRHILS